MPAKLDRCVRDVKDEGKSEDSAYAICVDSLKESEDRIKSEVAKTMAERGMIKELPETVSIPSGLSGTSIGAKKQQEAIKVCKPCEMEAQLKKQLLDSMI